MNKQVKILLQTTIPYTEDDWHIGRFSLLADHLSSLKDENGNELYDVTTRNREAEDGTSDAVISGLDGSDFDQLWLFGLEVGEGLTKEECEAITRFRQSGRGILATRDHNDMGASMCTIGGVGAAHYFHSKHQDPDESRRCRDDDRTLNVDWPNYHSGANGDFQRIETVDHPLLRRPDGSLIEYFPSHPHEGAVGAPEGANASVIATSKSLVTGRPFNLVVAFDNETDDHGNRLGRAIAESSFHHMVDYNWNPEMGCPSFLEEPPGDQYKREPEKLNDVKQYLANAAAWLAGRN
jgi:hypothetical protein